MSTDRPTPRPRPRPAPARRGPEFEALPDPVASPTLERPDEPLPGGGRTEGPATEGDDGVASRPHRRRLPIPSGFPGRGSASGHAWRRPALSRPRFRVSRAARLYLILLAAAVLLWVIFSAAAGFEYDQGRAAALPVLLMTSPWWLLFLVVNPGQWPGLTALVYLLVGSLVNAVLINRWTTDGPATGRHPFAREPPA